MKLTSCDVFNSDSVELPANIPRDVFDKELAIYGLGTDQVWDLVFWRLDEDISSNDDEDQEMMDD